MTANNICDKLRKAGYWADFINPFSGKPYQFPFATNSALYETDEKFRCLDFQIFEVNDCKIISSVQDQTKKKFVGKLVASYFEKKN